MSQVRQIATKISKQGKNIVFTLLVIALAIMPILYLNGADNGALITFLGKCIAFAILAIGIDLIWGYTGILSLGQGLFFALGGYAMAMYLKMVETKGSITEFMHTGGLTELPAIWMPFLNLPLSLFLVLLVPGIVAGVLGFFIFKSRVKGVYFSIISQALTWAAFSIFIALSPYTNGNIGISEIKSIFGSTRGPNNMDNLVLLFFVALAILVIVYVFATVLTKTKFGKLLIAIRDGENRTYFSGYSVSRYKTVIYVISAVLAGIGGAIFVNFNSGISPSQMTIAYSIMMVIWVAIGGRGTILGAVLGAFIINLGEYQIATGSMIEAWQFIVGGIFVVVILFFKGGIVGVFAEQLPAAIKRLQSKKDDGDDNHGSSDTTATTAASTDPATPGLASATSGSTEAR
jgi:urea transport system permease protein